MQIFRVIPSNFTRLLISFSGIIITCFQVYVVDLMPGSKIKQLKLLCHSGIMGKLLQHSAECEVETASFVKKLIKWSFVLGVTATRLNLNFHMTPELDKN